MEKSDLQKELISFSRFGSILVGTLSSAVLIGWIINADFLKSILPGFLAMNPVEAMCFIFASLALYIRIEREELSPGQFFIVNLLCGIIFTVGITTFLSNFFSLDVRPDKILFTQELGGSLIALNTSINFILIALALAAYKKNISSTLKITQLFTLIAGLITMFAGVGYLYNVLAFYRIYVFSPMQINTVSAFTLLCFCILISTHSRGIMRVLTENLHVSSLARRLIIAVIILPVLLGSLRMTGLSFFDSQTGTAFLVVTQIVIFTVVIWIVTRILYDDELEKNRMTENIKEQNVKLEQAHEQLKTYVKDLEDANKRIKDLLNHEQKLQDITSG